MDLLKIRQCYTQNMGFSGKGAFSTVKNPLKGSSKSQRLTCFKRLVCLLVGPQAEATQGSGGSCCESNTKSLSASVCCGGHFRMQISFAPLFGAPPVERWGCGGNSVGSTTYPVNCHPGESLDSWPMIGDPWCVSIQRTASANPDKGREPVMENLLMLIGVGLSFLFSLANIVITLKELRSIKEQLELTSYKGYMWVDGKWVAIPGEATKAGRKLAELRQGYGLLTSGLSDHILDRESKKFYLFPKGTKVELPDKK